MWQVFFGALIFMLAQKAGKSATEISGEEPSKTDEVKLTPEFVKLAEDKVKEHYAYILDCYDVAKKEGQNVLQWLFGAIIGGLGLVGSLAKADYWPLVFGAFLAVCWAARKAAILIGCLNSQEILPPGNSSEAFKTMRDEGASDLMMRWREARGMTIRANKNNKIVELVAKSVDKARNGMAYIPAWFLGGSAVAWVVERAYKAGCIKHFLDSLGL